MLTKDFKTLFGAACQHPASLMTVCYNQQVWRRRGVVARHANPLLVPVGRFAWTTCRSRTRPLRPTWPRRSRSSTCASRTQRCWPPSRRRWPRAAWSSPLTKSPSSRARSKGASSEVATAKYRFKIQRNQTKPNKGRMRNCNCTSKQRISLFTDSLCYFFPHVIAKVRCRRPQAHFSPEYTAGKVCRPCPRNSPSRWRSSSSPSCCCTSSSATTATTCRVRLVCCSCIFPRGVIWLGRETAPEGCPQHQHPSPPRRELHRQ